MEQVGELILLIGAQIYFSNLLEVKFNEMIFDQQQ